MKGIIEMHFIKITVFFIVISLLFTGCSVTTPKTTETTSPSVPPISSIRAQDDFYGYVNLETLQGTTLEYGQTQAGSFSNIDTEQQLLDSMTRIVSSSEVFPDGSCEQIARDAYLQYLDFQADEAAIINACHAVEAELDKINNVQSLDELMSMAEELRTDFGCVTLSNLTVTMDYFNPDEYGIAWMQATDLCGVPLEEVDENTYLAEQYEKRIIDTLRVMGYSYEAAEGVAHNLMLMIIDVAWATNFDIANAADPFSYTSFMSSAEIDAALSHLSVIDFELMAGIHDNPYGGWLIMDKGQLTAIDALFDESNLEELKALVAYDFLAQYGEYITSEHSIYEEYFPTSQESIDLQAIGYIHQIFPLVLSDLYVKAYYTDDMDQQFSRMCEDIRESYRELITDSDWLSQETRVLLLEKLDNIRFVDGGFCLEQMKDDPSLNDVFGANVFETQRNVAMREHAKSIENIGQPRNRLALGMPMHLVNACYGYDNTVTITVAIMGAPFFDANADYFTNLGGLGAVVAHEVGHAFDSSMIKYDANGVYNPLWLSAEDMAALESRNEVAVDYFENSFTVFDVYRVDGELTLGENYADLGSMECITNIASTDDEYILLFENYARIWCELTLNTNVIDQLSEDEHSPATIRVNAILATTDAFYDIYDLNEGDGMYVSPDERISRWK